MESQNKRILNYLKRGHRMTPMDALELFGCFRLAARVYDLRQEGHNISKQIIELSNGVNVAEYSLDQSTSTPAL
jgi:hypothetical protein